MAVDQAGDGAPAAEIDHLGVRPARRHNLPRGTDGTEAPVGDGDGIGTGVGGIEGGELAVGQDHVGWHHVSFRAEFSCRQRAEHVRHAFLVEPRLGDRLAGGDPLDHGNDLLSGQHAQQPEQGDDRRRGRANAQEAVDHAHQHTGAQRQKIGLHAWIAVSGGTHSGSLDAGAPCTIV